MEDMKVFLLLLSVYCCQAVAQPSTSMVMLEKAAKEKGAVCLDGSPGGYLFRPGVGSGTNKWLIGFEFGDWCFDEDECLQRSKSILGSSKSWSNSPTWQLTQGILSTDNKSNPNFYNWNLAYLMYCDGASFSGNVTKPVVYKGTTLYFRGIRIVQAALEDLATRGLDEASDVIVTGCSAGGHATYLHADYIREFLPSNVKYKVLADAGFFLDGKNWTGQYHFRTVFQYVFKMQNCSDGVNSDCIAAYPGEEWKCFFPQYFFHLIKTPVFVANSPVDQLQMTYVLQYSCELAQECPQEVAGFYRFRNSFLQALKPVLESPTSGAFVTVCENHCMTDYYSAWTTNVINGTFISEAFTTWYHGNKALHIVGCPYPCKSKCPLQ